jgi:selenocysteine-specific elongation factor
VKHSQRQRKETKQQHREAEQHTERDKYFFSYLYPIISHIPCIISPILYISTLDYTTFSIIIIILYNIIASTMASSSSVPSTNANTVLNVNIGILGHVDSGKTSLVKALSTLLSTAALDKHPQSQQRGITLDLGFSSFTIPLPRHLQAEAESDRYNALQVTLVDCPGHASLIRTIIGGAQIIDMMVLVVDVNKGIQTQTAECIVIGEITTDKMIIVLNKIDLLAEEEREEKISKAKKRLTRALASSKFASSPMIPLSAVVGGEKVAAVTGGGRSASSTKSSTETIGIPQLIETICSYLTPPVRVKEAPLYFAIDHCFAIKGHGTVLTGTILSGSVAVNSQIELPQLQVERKVKSLQMFRQPVQSAKQGDRVGICVTNLGTYSKHIYVSEFSY